MKNLKKMWWLIALRGLLGILVGLVAIIWPGLTFLVFILVAGIYILIEGIVNTIVGLCSIGKNNHWGVLLLEGLLGILVGWILFTQPSFITFTTGLFIQIVGIWLVLSGLLRILLSFFIMKTIKNEFFMILSGLLSLIVGGILFAQPVTGLVALIWIVGFFAIFTGILFIAFSMKLKES